MEGNKSDPLQILPHEMWVKIVQLYTRDQPEGPLPLLDISSAWQNRILHSPELWTTIHLGRGEDEHVRAECFFHLSKPFGVELVLDRNSNVTRVLTKYSERIKSLVFRTQTKTPYSTMDILLTSLALSGGTLILGDSMLTFTRGTYPNLAYIYVEPPCEEVVLIPRGLIEACPALIGIYGAYIDQGTVSCLPPTVTAFGVFGDGGLYKGIGGQLEALRIQYIPWASDNPGQFEDFTIPSTRLRLFEFTLPLERWMERRKTANKEYGPIRAFTSAVHYDLHTLSVTMSCYDISSIFPCISTCRALRDLRLRLYLDYDSDVAYPWSVPPLTSSEIGHIRKLTLSTAVKSLSVLSHDTRASLATILQIFSRNAALRDLEELRLSFFDEHSMNVANQAIRHLLHATKNLKELYLAGLTLWSPIKTTRKVLLSNLHTLYVDQETDLEYLEAPNLACLRCQRTVKEWYIPRVLPGRLSSFRGGSFFFYQWNEYLVTNDPDCEPFPGLAALELTFNNLYPFPRLSTHHPTMENHHKILLAPLNFSNLRSISFVGTEYICRFGTAALDHFMLDILLSPNHCPRLHTIQSGRYPNWALAAAMFHRRNSFKGVTSVLSFQLPRYPQISILEVITRALAAVDEPLHDILSAAVGMDQILKQRWEMHTFRTRVCRYCVFSGYTLCESKHLSALPVPAYDTSLPTLVALLDLKPTGAWTERLMGFTRDIWMEYLREPTAMIPPHEYVESCHKHDPTSLVHIGPHTLTGLTYDKF